MTWPDEFGRLSAVILAILLRFTFQGAYCQLVVSPAGPTLVNALAGRDVTLAVSFSGATDPAVTWFMAGLPVVTWTINSGDAPDIADNREKVLRLETDGSLSFVNVTLEYTSNYTIEMTKSGLNISSTTFTLKVFGVLNLTNVQTSQGGVYTCKLLNGETSENSQKSIVINVYERPSGGPTCSVQSVNNVDLQYLCRWSWGSPQVQLSFPALSNTSSGTGNLSLTVTASQNLDGKTVTCMAYHPVELINCSITAGSPRMFLPAVRTTVDSDGKIVVTIRCVSEASPQAVVSWYNGSEAVTSTTPYQISRDTTQLEMRDYNVGNFLLQNYTCICRNSLGSQRREIQLRGPSISDSSLFANHNGTIVTLTWEVPPTSIVTGFDIQMKGPHSLSRNRNGTQTRGSSNRFHTIQQKPGAARSADIFNLDPKLRYSFWVIPKARMTEGQPSEVQRIGPGEGLSGSAIAGLAAGIPCGLLFLVLLGGFIYFCVYFNKKKRRQARYPKSRAVEKAVTTPTETTGTPHSLLTGGLKSPPDYNGLLQTPSERSVALPAFVPPPPVRTATTV
ncbi:hypothetical protein VZT92_027656 [Zoarces viviparus]|uniref:Ig-like domain-containing protein n=1 Tax=Zoarces viviparus TaxID=48416 RepID=A0AAW1DXE7_ZOAVI